MTESSNLSMAKRLLQNRSFIRCRKETLGEYFVKMPKKTRETPTDLTKTAVEIAHLDHRPDIIEHLNSIQNHGCKSQSVREWS